MGNKQHPGVDILREVDTELKEDAEDLNFKQDSAKNLFRIIHEFNIQCYNSKQFNHRDVIKRVIKENQLTTFFLIDIGVLIRRVKLWMKNLPQVEPFYAVKCNPNPVILRTLADLGVGFDVASRGEISLLKDLHLHQVSDVDSDDDYGFNDNMVIFAHPTKEDDHISCAQTENVNMMTFDNVDELKKVSHLHPNAKLVLRILVDDSRSAIPFGSKFGCPKDNLEEIFVIASALSLNIVGVSFHVGSSCFDGSAYRDAIKDSRQVFDLGTKYGFTMNLLDIGGGFPGVNDDFFIQICDAIKSQLEESFSDVPNLRVIAEPGRFFVTACATLAVQVVGRKLLKSQSIIHYTLNTGLYSMCNNIVFDKTPVVFNVLKQYPEETPMYKSVLFGQTCDSGDYIAKDVQLPELYCHNWLYAENHGAYTVCAASAGFNGFPLPQEIYVFTY